MPDSNDFNYTIPTGIDELDSVITGLNRSDLIVLAARPGVGKTSFALNIARHAAVNAKRRVAFFSLEMSREQLVSRLLLSEAMVESTKLRFGKLTENDWNKLAEARDILSQAELYLYDNPDISVQKIKSTLRRLGNVDLVIVDHLPLMRSFRRSSELTDRMAVVVRNLKIMARDLNIPVIVVSPLRRPIGHSNKYRPGLSELRRFVTQNADIIVFLHKEPFNAASWSENITEDMDFSAAELIVAKNCRGSIGSIAVNWDPAYMRFTPRETNCC